MWLILVCSLIRVIVLMQSKKMVSLTVYYSVMTIVIDKRGMLTMLMLYVRQKRDVECFMET